MANAAAHADVYFQEQELVDPTMEAGILVVTSDCKGVPMRRIDAPQTKRSDDLESIQAYERLLGA